MFERSELIEPLGEKRKVNSLARWEAKPSRSKNERIDLIMLRSNSPGLRRTKRDCVDAGG
jgi:hypothetical protein